MRAHPVRVVSIATLLALSITACAQRKGRESDDAPVVAAARAPAAGSGALAAEGRAPVEPGRKVIRTGRVEIVVPAIAAARARLTAQVEAAGGYLDATESLGPDGGARATVTVRIPAAAFGGLLDGLGEIGEIANESTSAADVTAEYVDVRARLAGAQTLEKRLLELAADRSGTLDQVLAVERELARVRAEIEGHQGHLRQWDDAVAMSTLTVALTRRAEPGAPPPTAGLGERSNTALRGSLDALAVTGAAALVLLITLLPWLLVLVPAGLLGRRIWRRVRPPMPVAIVHAPAAAEPPSP